MDEEPADDARAYDPIRQTPFRHVEVPTADHPACLLADVGCSRPGPWHARFPQMASSPRCGALLKDAGISAHRVVHSRLICAAEASFHGRRNVARQRSGEISNSFNEGPDMADLQGAEALLDALSCLLRQLSMTKSPAACNPNPLRPTLSKAVLTRIQRVATRALRQWSARLWPPKRPLLL